MTRLTLDDLENDIHAGDFADWRVVTLGLLGHVRELSAALEGLKEAPFGKKTTPCFCWFGEGINIDEEGHIEHCTECKNLCRVLARYAPSKDRTATARGANQ